MYLLASLPHPIRISSFPSDDYRFTGNAFVILKYILSIVTVFGTFIIEGTLTLVKCIFLGDMRILCDLS